MTWYSSFGKLFGVAEMNEVTGQLRNKPREISRGQAPRGLWFRVQGKEWELGPARYGKQAEDI